MDVIVYKVGDGVAVVYPVVSTDAALGAVPNGAEYRIMAASELPSDESRARWRWTASGPLTVADPVPVVPASISKVQFVRAARAADLWATYQAAIEAHPDWAYVTEIPRDDPLVQAMASQLGFTEEQLDALWIAGASL